MTNPMLGSEIGRATCPECGVEYAYYEDDDGHGRSDCIAALRASRDAALAGLRDAQTAMRGAVGRLSTDYGEACMDDALDGVAKVLAGAAPPPFVDFDDALKHIEQARRDRDAALARVAEVERERDALHEYAAAADRDACEASAQWLDALVALDLALSTGLAECERLRE